MNTPILWVCLIRWISASDKVMTVKCKAVSKMSAQDGAWSYAFACGYRVGMGSSTRLYTSPDVAAVHRAWKRGTGMK